MAGGRYMTAKATTVRSQVESNGMAVQTEPPPSRVTTTLYDLIAALQERAGTDDAQVVATMVHLLRSRRLTWVGQAREPRGLSQRAGRSLGSMSPHRSLRSGPGPRAGMKARHSERHSE